MKKLVLLLSFIVLAWGCQNAPEEKTAFADIQELAKNYHEIQKIEEEMKAKETAFQKKYDSIGKVLQSKYENFLKRANKMPQKKAQEEYNSLMAEQQQLGMQQQQELQNLQNELAEKRDKALKNMEDKITEYGEKKGYTYIFNKGDFGILYGDKSKDITDELKNYLNDNQSGSKPEKNQKEDTKEN